MENLRFLRIITQFLIKSILVFDVPNSIKNDCRYMFRKFTVSFNERLNLECKSIKFLTIHLKI